MSLVYVTTFHYHILLIFSRYCTTECKCEDKYNDCQSWANSGECGLNLNWMSTNCPKSCRTCGGMPLLYTEDQAYSPIYFLEYHLTLLILSKIMYIEILDATD